ncbi:MAG: amidohydrolase family protein [Fidelibacterota bacterium]|nr:MAG: amidohydrolase family protein [Candidatus Neomarinimicrobiota bacterium]
MSRYIFLIVLLLTAGCGPSKDEGQVPRDTGAGKEKPARDVYADFKPTPEQYPIPESVLKVTRTDIKKAKYPAVDIHFHGRDWADAEKQLALMDELGVAMIANMDGYFGERLETAMRNAASSNGRLINFARVDWEGIDDPDWPERAAADLAESYRVGAAALKISKNLGMSLKYADGRYVMPDDPRLDRIWETCARSGLPVMIHTADPPARWQPIGPNNERYEAGMWRSSPDGNYYGSDLPHYTELLAAQERLYARHPNTIFIGAHVTSRGWDLAEVSRLLDTYPNLYVDMNARLQELGRQPYTARRFFLKYQDRILFGTDGNPTREADFWIPHWRFLETDDEYFNHPAQMRGPLGAGLQGRWMIYGVFLPDGVLRKIYYANALKLLPDRVRDRYQSLYQ